MKNNKRPVKNIYNIEAIKKNKNAALGPKKLFLGYESAGPGKMFKHSKTFVPGMAEREHDGDNDVVRGESIHKKVTFDPADAKKGSNRM